MHRKERKGRKEMLYHEGHEVPIKGTKDVCKEKSLRSLRPLRWN